MAFLDQAINFGDVQVSTGYSNAATSVVLTGSEGAKLPTTTIGGYNLVWWNYTDYPNPKDDPNREIVRVTARSTDTLTVTRAQEGTSATSKNTASKTYRMALVPTKKLIEDIEAYLQGKAVSDLASASTVDLASMAGTFARITGTTTITGFGTANSGVTRIVYFAGALILTHSPTGLILPTGANITTATGDVAIFVSNNSGMWLCASYVRADGTALAAASGGSATALDVTTTGDYITVQLPKTDLTGGTITYTGIIDASFASDGQALQWYLPNIRGGTADNLRFNVMKRAIMRVMFKQYSGTAKVGFGFGEQGSYLGDANTAAGARVGFTWDGASTLYAVTSDGVGTPTSTTVSSPPTQSQWNEYVIDYDAVAASAKFYVNGVLKATHTTELPVNTENCRAAIGAGGAIGGQYTYPIVAIKLA